MARAKRTDRAEARRRHRAATADLTADETLEAEASAGAATGEGVVVRSDEDRDRRNARRDRAS